MNPIELKGKYTHHCQYSFKIFEQMLLWFICCPHNSRHFSLVSNLLANLKTFWRFLCRYEFFSQSSLTQNGRQLIFRCRQATSYYPQIKTNRISKVFHSVCKSVFHNLFIYIQALTFNSMIKIFIQLLIHL